MKTLGEIVDAGIEYAGWMVCWYAIIGPFWPS